MLAVRALMRRNQEELHDYERPIAYISYHLAESNRDRKKKNQPFKLNEFFFYEDKANQNLPEPKYGAAALKLIEMRLFPHWALFTYKDLKVRAVDAMAPELLCFQCDDAIILAPHAEGRELMGMLIAAKTASEQVREMVSPDGHVITVRMPVLAAEFQADEEASVRILS